MWSNFKRSARRFDDDSGAVAVIFGFCLIMVMGLMALTIDGGRAYYVASKTAAATDAAALAAAKAMNEGELSDAEVADVARKFYDANLLNLGIRGAAVGGFNVDTDRDKGAVTVKVDTRVPTTFARIMRINNVTVSKSATAVYGMRDIELAMMLDVTGSMRGRKISDLKAAAHDVVDLLLASDAGSNKIRIGLAPYSASVNAGRYAEAVSDDVSRDGCVFERSGIHAYADTEPRSGHYLGAMPNPRRPSNGQYVCPGAEILPITDDKDLLKRTIDDYDAGGWTAGHLGVAWSWYLISPKWSGVWPTASQPVAYDDSKTIKAVILMTDGQFNTSYANGRINRTSTQQTEKLCENMREEGVIVYAVAFEAPSSAQETLKECASSVSHYFDAENGAELREAFRAIAQSLANLRVAK